jgi:phytoene dehydrogenase-like protein
MTHTVIIGGGLAGLTAAAQLAKAGIQVTLFEKARQVGGRACSTQRDGYTLNMGAHALYHTGPGVDTLRKLGVRLQGGKPAVRPRVLAGGETYDPLGVLSLVGGIGGGLRLASVLIRLTCMEPAAYDNITIGEWVREHLTDEMQRAAFLSYVNVLTYINAPERLPMSTVIEQVQLFFDGNVLYLDGGWRALVNQLRTIATEHGATIYTGQAVERVCYDKHVMGVQLTGGQQIAADSVIIAASPAAAARLTQHAALKKVASAAQPVRVAALNVGLGKLPNPKVTFGLGIDDATYFSVHSASANLAPAGGAVVHVMQYLRPGQTTNGATLETVLDTLQPGWRAHVVIERFLPHITVMHDIPGSRPSPAVTGVGGLFITGDWVGEMGILANASLASATCAAQEIIRDTC